MTTLGVVAAGAMRIRIIFAQALPPRALLQDLRGSTAMAVAVIVLSHSLPFRQLAATHFSQSVPGIAT